MKCVDCRAEKDLSAFYFRKDNSSYRPQCKLCMCKAGKRRRSIRSIKHISVNKSGYKFCRRCDQNKEKDNFSIRRSSYDGLNPYCRGCDSLLQKKNQFGISSNEYLALVKSQDGRCFICNRDDVLYLDHDHKTGKIGKLLCGYCNRGLGMFFDSVELLDKSIRYIKQFRG